MNKKSILLWLILYFFISFLGFFISIFGIMTMNIVGINVSNSANDINYMVYLLPVMFFLTPFIAWSFYKRNEFKSCLLTTPVFPVLYIITLVVLFNKK